jgi:Pentapeptide repeats (8 copies)/Domain of unknown function (DUF4214)
MHQCNALSLASHHRNYASLISPIHNAMLKPQILATSTLLLLLGAATSVRAENSEHLRQLINTGRCRGCDLSYVNLSRENLSNADLAGANLQGANLSYVNFNNADLSSANLQDANLNNTDFTNTILQGANLRGTIFANRSSDPNQRDRPGWGRQEQGHQNWGRQVPTDRSNNSTWNHNQSGNKPQDTRRYYETEVRRIYEQVTNQQLGRRELRRYVRDLAEGRSLADIRRDIVRSPETKAALNRLYQEILGRNIDPSGLRTWTQYLSRNRSLNDVHREISRSQEARDRR